MEIEHISLGARVNHPTFGVGVVFAEDARTLHIFFKDHGEQTIARSFEGLHRSRKARRSRFPKRAWTWTPCAKVWRRCSRT